MEKSLASVHLLTAGESNEWGKTELRLASDKPEPEGILLPLLFERRCCQVGSSLL